MGESGRIITEPTQALKRGENRIMRRMNEQSGNRTDATQYEKPVFRTREFTKFTQVNSNTYQRNWSRVIGQSGMLPPLPLKPRF